MKTKFWIALGLATSAFAQTAPIIAGTGTIGFSGDGGPAVNAQLSTPWAVRADASGNLYFIDHGNFRVRKIDTSGNISTVAGNGQVGLSLNGGPATQVPLTNPGDLTIAKDGSWYIADGVLQIVNGGNLTSVLTTAALALAMDGNGVLYYAQSGVVYRYNPGGAGTLVAGTLGQLGDDGDGGPATQAHFTIASGGLAADSSGNVYITDIVAGRVRKFAPGGNIQTVAGTGVLGFSGEGGPATKAQIAPAGIALDTAGNIYIAEGGNHRVRRVDGSGIITTVYYNGAPGSTFSPDSISVDANTNIYVGDSGANVIRKIVPVPVSSGAKPSISSGGVLSAAGNVAGLTPGSWVAIYGQNLAATTRQWDNSDFQGQQLPRTLDGVSVMIDNRPAAVYYISPTQIDVQVPDDATIGPVNVTVQNGQGVSDPVTTNMSEYAPALFAVGQSVAALHADNTIVGNASLAPGATPAKPGETIAIYGTGFGPTMPATPAGLIVNSANPLADPSLLSITIAGIPAQVRFAGMVAAGLYQFNVVVPSVAAGEQPVSATMAHVPIQTGLTLTVQP